MMAIASVTGGGVSHRAIAKVLRVSKHMIRKTMEVRDAVISGETSARVTATAVKHLRPRYDIIPEDVIELVVNFYESNTRSTGMR